MIINVHIRRTHHYRHRCRHHNYYKRGYHHHHHHQHHHHQQRQQHQQHQHGNLPCDKGKHVQTISQTIAPKQSWIHNILKSCSSIPLFRQTPHTDILALHGIGTIASSPALPPSSKDVMWTSALLRAFLGEWTLGSNNYVLAELWPFVILSDKLWRNAACSRNQSNCSGPGPPSKQIS